MATAAEILSTHRISPKTTATWTGYSIQFTYPSGKKHQFIGKTEDEVRQKVNKFFGVASLTYKELCQRYMDDPEVHGGDARNRNSLKYQAEKFLPYFGDKLAADVTAENIQAAGRAIVNGGCKTNSVNTMFRTVRRMYDYAIRKELLEVNPAEGVTYFRARESQFERNYLGDREIYGFLTACKTHHRYVFAFFLICGIPLDRVVPLRWKDIDFENRKVGIERCMASRTSADILELQRTEKQSIEEPKMCFDYLIMELEEQVERLGIRKEVLTRSDHLIMTNERRERNLTCKEFNDGLGYFMKTRVKADYNIADVYFTSAVYAFKAVCDIITIAAMLGFVRALDMFKYPEKYDCFESRASRSVNDYFDALYKKTQEV